MKHFVTFAYHNREELQKDKLLLGFQVHLRLLWLLFRRYDEVPDIWGSEEETISLKALHMVFSQKAWLQYRPQSRA